MSRRQLTFWRSRVLIAGVAVFSFSCSNIVGGSKPLPFHATDYRIASLRYQERPYVGEKIVPLDYRNSYPTDDEGIILFIYKDQGYYHPVNISQWALRFLDSYVQTDDPEYLQLAEIFAEKLLDLSIAVKDALYLPYDFDIPVHGHPVDKMIAPWYSGMAQGQSLSVFARLYDLTGERKYLTSAEKIFRSFFYLREGNNPWTVYVDSSGYYWIEEYPMEVPGQVLNGFIFAIYGLYDYHLLFHDTMSRQLLQGATTTIHHYISAYRNKGDISKYCLKHGHQNGGYHMVHIDQLDMLYRITGDRYLKDMADSLYADYHTK